MGWIQQCEVDDEGLPVPTQIVSSEEFEPPDQTVEEQRVEHRLTEIADEARKHLGISRRACLAMNEVFGNFFDVSAEEMFERQASDEKFPKTPFMNTRAAKLLCLIFPTLRLCGNHLSFVMMQLMTNARRLSLVYLIASGALGVTASAQERQPVSVQPDSPRWKLEGEAKPAEYLGRKSLYLNGGGATLNDLEMRDGIIDVDVATPAIRGFFGIQFRISSDDANGEWIYLRPHKSGLPDAMQYTPVLNTGLNWQIYSGPGFIASIDVPKNEWFHLRLEVAGARARFYVKDMEKPALVVDDLKSGIQKGRVALAVLTGATYFSNFEFRETAPVAWERHYPSTPPGTLIKWSLSPSFDALARDLERAVSPAERDAIHWQDVEAEPPGIVAINRYRESPHPRVTFANDFSKRLEPQPGMKVVYARTSIDSDRDVVKKLYLGYSDDVSVFINGKILYRGRSAQNFRDPGFLGIVNPENDVVYIPLNKGRNELMLAVSELGGGWGFICRVAELENHGTDQR